MSSDPVESRASFSCPRCGEPMAPGWLECSGSDHLRVEWKSASDDGEVIPSYHWSHALGGDLRSPAQRCRACESVLVDFSGERLSPPAPSFEERTSEARGERLLEVLVEVLREGEPGACAKAVQAFARAGPLAKPLLRRLLDDEDPDVRVDARKALKLIEERED